MSRRNLISSFVLGLACGLIALPASARADRDARRPSAGHIEARRTSQASKASSANAVAGTVPTASRGGSGAPAASAPARTDSAANAAERARLAAELDRINAEIDALKRNPRGIRDDYKLRNRMADAEAVSRRLTDLEARGGSVRPPEPAGPAAAWPREVPAGPADDRADLEAKADILADEARRLTVEANRIETRVVDLRARRELRRRAGQLERDPFSPLEQPKPRVLALGTGTSQAGSGTKNGSGPPRTGTNLGAEGAAPGGTGSSPAAPTAAPAAGPTAGTTTGTDSAGGAPPPTNSNTTSATASPQPYGVLDPTLLAQVRRLDAPGAPPANLDTLEAAVTTLRARSTELTRSAAALRARAAQRAY